jgi:hypothetical protein
MIRSCTHERLAKTSNDSRVNAGGHKSKCVSCRDKAIVRLKVFKSSFDNANARQA